MESFMKQNPAKSARLRSWFTLALLIASIVVFSRTLFAAELEDRTQKDIQVKPGTTLFLDADFGGVEVKAATGKTVHVDVYRKVEAATKEEAQRILDDYSLTSGNEGDQLHLRGEFKTGWGPSRGSGRHNHCHHDRSLTYAENLREFQYVLSVPTELNLRIRTEAGEVTGPDVGVALDIETSAGGIEAGNVAREASLRTAGGSIRVGKIGGRATLDTAGGNIESGDINGDADVNTAGGSIRLGKVNGPVNAKTAGGEIRIESATGSVNAKTVGGSISAHLSKLNAASSLETLAGNVTLYLPADVKANIQAETRGAGDNIENEFAPDQSEGRHMDTPLNGGGPQVYLKASYGRVQLRKNTF